MLESLRNMMSGIAAKILIGLLVVSFAIWGASGAFIGGGGTNTVVVGETKVGLADYRLAYLGRVNALQRQLNQRLSREQLRALGVEQSILGEVVAGAVLDETARKMGLGVSEDGLASVIGRDPAFQDATGNFSRQQLEFALRQVGMQEDDYINNRRSAAVRDQLLAAVAEDVTMPQAFFEAYQDYETQRRVFRYVVVTPDEVEVPADPSEIQLRDFHEANKAGYRAPEYRKLVLVRLTPEDIADPDALSREEVLAEYERTRQQYTTPEKRRIEQLSFSDRPAAEAAARRLAEGESFEVLMEEAGRSAEDVELGLLGSDDIPDQDIADTAFELEAGATSEVVEGVFGPVIVRVTEIVQGQERPLESVEKEIRRALALDLATEALFDLHDRLEDERAAGDPLAEAARKVGLKARTIDNVDRAGRAPDGAEVTGIPEAERVLAEAFQTDEAVEADPVALGSSGFVWYEVAGITQERQKTFDEVRDEVRQAWIAGQSEKKVEETAQAIRDRVAKGEDFATVSAELLTSAADVEQVQPQTSVLMTRNETGQDLVRDAVASGFSITTQDVVVAAGPEEGSRVVLQVTEVIEGDGGDLPQNVRSRIDDALGNDLINTIIADLQSREDVAVNNQAIETAITY